MLPLVRGQQNISGVQWPGSAPPASLPFLGFIGVSPQQQPVPLFNQENLPFPVHSPVWNSAWNMPSQPSAVQPHGGAGRPILGRRCEPNLQMQQELAKKMCSDGNSNGRCSLDSLIGKNGNERDTLSNKQLQPLSPIDIRSQNNNQVNRKNLNPSPYSLMGLNTSIPPPPIVNVPRSKDNEYYFHPITQTTCNPVELHVTNLDQSIDLREMKKLLLAAFREHVMVLHVSVFVQSDGTLAASVKVPSTQDAQYAISQLHRRKVGFKRIMIAYAHSSAPQNPQSIKNQIVSLLLEVPGHKMPLFTFRELFASRYLSSVSVSDLYRMRDVCVIMEENNGRTIALNPEYRNTPSPASCGEDLPYCQRHSQQRVCSDKGWAEQEQPSLANVRVPLSVLAKRLITLVNTHDNCLPLASLMDCYASQFEPLSVDEQGAPLEHLVTCVSGMELVHSAANKHLRLCPNKPPLDAKLDDSFAMCVSPSLANQVNLFARELVDLLKMQPHCQLMFNRFIPAYHHHFGRQCRVADYGFTKLIDLLETLPHVVQVMGEGNKRVVTLSHRAQVRRFTSDLLRVLKSQASKQLMVSELHQLFERALGRPFDPVDYGLCFLDDLLSQLSANIVLVTGEGAQMTISIPKREQTPEEMERTKQFAVQVVELLSHTPQCAMEFAKFIPAYHHHYGTQCRVADFGFTKLIELFEAIPDVVKVEDDGEGVRRVSLTQLEKLKVLSHQMAELAGTRYPPGLPLDSVHPTYMWKYGYALKPSAYGCHDMQHLLVNLSSVKVVTDADNTLMIIPEDHSESRTLCMRVLHILWKQNSGRMLVVDFEQSFVQLYQRPCNRETLETDLRGMVEVREAWVQLTALQLFARDLYHLLFAADGRMALSSIEAAYRQTFGAPLAPSRLGYTSLQALLQAIDYVVVVSGHANKKLVCINPQLAAGGISLPPCMMKNKYHNGSADQCINKDLSTHCPTSQSLLKGIQLKVNGDKGRQDDVWRATPAWTSKHSEQHSLSYSDSVEQPMVVNLPEPRTPPSKEECMALLSPAKFLMSASAFPFLPSPPDPSQLPKPSHFNLTQVGDRGSNSDVQDISGQIKRKPSKTLL